jgi:hypothetical protein
MGEDVEMRKYLWLFVLILGGLCAPRPSLADEAPKRLPQQSVGGIDAKDSGTVKGVVRFKGTKPPVKPISEIAGNAFCKRCYPDEVPNQDSFVFGKNGSDDTLENVLVYVSKGLEGKTFQPPSDPVVLDQAGCMYTPHVVAVMTGQTTLHNVMSMPRNNPTFNFGMPVQGGKTDKVFSHPEFKINLRCFMHPWMSGYVHVLPHPFFAITGGDGTFTIKGLPPGEYVISVLHETSLFEPDPREVTVKVGANQTKQVDFTYHSKADAKQPLK